MGAVSDCITADRYSFAAFKAGPGGHMLRGLGFGECLDGAKSWRVLRSLVVMLNDEGRPGCFADAVRRRDGTASSGERVLLHAIACAMDFAWLADELGDGRVWRRMDGVSGAHRDAVVACILQDAAQ